MRGGRVGKRGKRVKRNGQARQPLASGKLSRLTLRHCSCCGSRKAHASLAHFFEAKYFSSVHIMSITCVRPSTHAQKTTRPHTCRLGQRLSSCVCNRLPATSGVSLSAPAFGAMLNLHVLSDSICRPKTDCEQKVQLKKTETV